MFKRIRIAILLYILLFVAASQIVASRDSTDWDHPLWVDVYPVNGDGTEVSQAYVDALAADEFAAIEDFFATEAARFGIGLERPLRFAVGEVLEDGLPEIPDGSSLPHTLLWSLEMRWLRTRLNWASDRPRPDIVLFAVYHDAGGTPTLERSGALRKGLIAIANLFADRQVRTANHVVVTHELLHTLGATDKYDPSNNQPLFPIGFADPDARPLYPQRRAEIMAGRIPLNDSDAQIPFSLREVTVGAATAAEIRWARRH